MLLLTSRRRLLSSATSLAPPSLSYHNGRVIVKGDYKSLRDPLLALGFQYNAPNHTFALEHSELKTKLGPSEPVTIESILNVGRRLKTQGTPLTKTFSKSLPRLAVESDRVCVYNSFELKDGLKALGFFFDPDGKSWAIPVDEFKARFGNTITMDAIYARLDPRAQARASEPGGGGGRTEQSLSKPFAKSPPRLAVENDRVCVYNSFELKDGLKASGFVYDPDSKSWSLSLDDYTSRFGSTMTVAALIAGLRASTPADVQAELGGSRQEQSPPFKAPPPRLAVESDRVCVYNSFELKDGLKALGFSFDPDTKSWVIPVDDYKARFGSAMTMAAVHALLGLRPAEIHSESAQEQQQQQPLTRESLAQTLKMAVESGRVVVTGRTYPIRALFRAAGFRFDVERRAYVMDEAEYGLRIGRTMSATALAEKLLQADPVEVATMAAPRDADWRKNVKIFARDGNVHVQGSFNVKDSLKANGFMYETEDKSWYIFEQTYHALVGGDMSTQAFFEFVSKSNPDETTVEQRGDETVVTNGYSIRQVLDELGFVFDIHRPPSGAWVASTAQLRAKFDGAVPTASQLSSYKPAPSNPNLIVSEDLVTVRFPSAAAAAPFTQHLRHLGFAFSDGQWSAHPGELRQRFGGELPSTWEALQRDPSQLRVLLDGDYVEVSDVPASLAELLKRADWSKDAFTGSWRAHKDRVPFDPATATLETVRAALAEQVQQR